jgi:NAD-dependent deacetylase
MKKLVVLSGAGISAESGLQTFRGGNGLWNGYNIYEVASPQGWAKDYEMVLEFYNMRRREVANAKPNAGHIALAKLQEYFEVCIITQNIDNLHEQAGSNHVLHLHGEITKAQSTANPDLIYNIDFKDINSGNQCELGSQLRPFIVWFGEAVPKIDEAAVICSQADIFVIVGTSLQVYPAAGLVEYVPHKVPKFLIDPHIPEMQAAKHVTIIEQTAAIGLPYLSEILKKDYI